MEQHLNKICISYALTNSNTQILLHIDLYTSKSENARQLRDIQLNVQSTYFNVQIFYDTFVKFA